MAGSRRRPTARQQAIARVGRQARADGRPNGPRAGIERLPGGGLPRGGGAPKSARAQSQERVGGRQRAGVGRGEMPGLGHQLTRRVQSGAITKEQAQRTARERQTLRQKFGADWRQDVFGGQGRVQDARQRLAQNPSDPKLLALNQRLKQMRQDALMRARASNAAGGPQGAVPPSAGNGGTTAPPSGVRRPPSARPKQVPGAMRPQRRRRRRPAY